MATTGVGTQPQQSVSSGRPGWLTFFAVTSIVLGGLTVMGVAGELGSERMLNAQRALMQKTNQSMSNPMLPVQLEMQEKMAAAMRSGHAFLTALAPVGLLAALGMIVGGIGCLQMRKRARPLLLAALCLGLIYEGARAKPTMERQLALTDITQSSMTQMMQTAERRTEQRTGSTPNGASPQAVQQFVSTFSTFASLFAMATALAMLTLKVTFLIGGLIYLTRPRLRARFG